MSMNLFSEKHNKELQELLSWLGHPNRNPIQINKINESDCEIIQLNKNLYLYTTIDSIAEEISLKMYTEPETIGWVAAQATLSDLAACGCKPLGVLLSTIWQFGTQLNYQKAIAASFQEVLKIQNCFLLGGDNGNASNTVISCVGLGISDVPAKMRTGIQHNDFLCITGKSGRGAALCLDYLLNNSNRLFSEKLFRPHARISEGNILQKYANAVMDTSDGILTTVKQLCEINKIGIRLFWNEQTLDPLANNFCIANELPKSLIWISEHGDFELMAAISPQFIKQAKDAIPNLEVIGQFDQSNNAHEFFYTINNSQIKKVLSLNKTQFLANEKALGIEKIKNKLKALISYLKDNKFP